MKIIEELLIIIIQAIMLIRILIIIIEREKISIVIWLIWMKCLKIKFPLKFWKELFIYHL